MENITNNTIRNHIYEEVLQCGTKTGGEEVNCYELYTRKLSLMKESELFYPLYLAIIETAYLDAYVLLNNKIKLNMITEEEAELFNKLDMIGTMEELEDIIDADDTLLTKILPYSTEFCDINYLRKIMAMCSLSLLQQKSLYDDFELFDNDLTQYYDEVNAQTIGDYCKETINDVVSTNNIDTISAAENRLIYELEGFINFLAGNDVEFYASLISEILKTDYKWNKYMLDNGFTIEEEDEETHERIKAFERKDMNSLIADECMLNCEYLREVLTSFLMIKCYNMNMNDKQINENIVNDYFSKTKKKR